MTEDHPTGPAPAIAVSPEDQSSDRAQADENQSINVEKLDLLIDATAELGDAAKTIAASTGLADQQRARFMKLMFVMAAVTVILLVPILLIGVSSLRARSEINDCVQPTGKCFQQGQARTGKAVATITQVSVLAAVCAPGYVGLPIATRQKAIETCILARLPKGK